MKNKKLNLNLILTILILLILNSSLIKTQSSQIIFPGDKWAESSAENQGLDSKLIEEMVDYIDSETFFDSMVLVRNGYLIAETYKFAMDENETKHLWGITKGITSLLMAIAIDEGYIDSLDTKVFPYFDDRTIANYNSSKDNITIRHILTSSSGLEWPVDEYSYAAWIGSVDKIQYLLDLPMDYEPGTHYVENTGSMHLLTAILNITTGMYPIDFAKQFLYDPLGIEEITWTDDGNGVNYGGHGLYLRTRDLTRISYLILNNGYWNGEQVISSEKLETLFEPVWNLTLENDHERKLGCRFYSIPDYNVVTAMGSTMLVMAMLPEENISISLTGVSPTDKPPEDFYIILDDYLFPAMVENSSEKVVGITIPILLCSSILLLVIYRKRKV